MSTMSYSTMSKKSLSRPRSYESTAYKSRPRRKRGLMLSRNSRPKSMNIDIKSSGVGECICLVIAISLAIYLFGYFGGFGGVAYLGRGGVYLLRVYLVYVLVRVAFVALVIFVAYVAYRPLVTFFSGLSSLFSFGSNSTKKASIKHNESQQKLIKSINLQQQQESLQMSHQMQRPQSNQMAR